LNSVLALVAAGVAVIAALTVLGRQRRSVRGCRLPPGPVPLPVVGNLLSIDGQKPWVTYAEWATRYGDIYMIRVLQQDIIVINSEKIAKDLLDRRSRIYSDRPNLATREPWGWSFNFGFAPYGDRWRSQRRIFHQAFRAEAALNYRPTQLRKAHQLALDILNAPHDYYDHIQRFSAAVIMSIVYDYDVAPGHDHLVEVFERGNVLALESLAPQTASIIEAFPFVLSLPEWLPGTVYRRRAAISKDCAIQMVEMPFEHAKEREAAGSSASAMALDLLRGIKDSSQLQLLKDTCATAFVAGAETTTSTLRCFMLAMLQHPEVQERAQAEIDAVVGRNRLPDFDDRPNLPYIEAVLMETLRVYPVGPLGIAHATIADDIYEDIFIPKGFTVMVNIWAINRNKDVYPEPNIFKPERFFVDGKLCKDKPVDSLAYGFGRRVCPGRYNADSSVWAAMTSILSAFKISKMLNEEGEEVGFEPTFTHGGLTTAPHPFPCSIVPRLPNTDVLELLTARNI